jgi:hypothetical protein
MLSPRRLAIVTALALLAPSVPSVEAEGRRAGAAATTTKKPAKASAGKRAKRVKRTKGKRTRAKRHLARRTTRPRAVASNMPDGWAWPPSAAMIAAGEVCTGKLTELGVAWQPAEAVERIATPITVPSMTFGDVKLVSWFRKPPFVMDCHLALALAVFAPNLHELGVRELKFSRIYGYTQVQVNGQTKSTLSRHALGLAIDLRAVVDADGRDVVVEQDYKLGDPLLLRLETFFNDSGGFRTVLTPGNDPASHHDHFHAEAKVEYGP